MFIPTTSTVAVRCSVCGQLEFHALSLFDFARVGTCKIQCSCGRTLLNIGTKNRKRFWLQVECVLCETKHLFHFSRKQIWSSEVLELTCEENGLEICYIGPTNKVRICVENLDRSIAEMAEELGYTDYFENPDIMYDVLDRLYQIAENGNLLCNCGNQDIEIEIFPDYLELKCGYCHSSARIMARTEKDLDFVNNSTKIQLSQSFVNDLQKRKAHRNKKLRKGDIVKR